MRIFYSLLSITLLLVLGTSNNTNAQFQCSSKEYIYLNDTKLGEVHKFEIDPATGQITEIPSKLGPGTPWMTGFTNPHGLGSDLNGNLYIGDDPQGPIYKLRSDGGTVANDATLWNSTVGQGLTNIGSIDNYIFANGGFNQINEERERIQVLDACTGDRLGSICLEGATGLDWGMQVLDDGTILYTEGIDVGIGFVPTRSIWKFTFDPSQINNTPNCIPKLQDGGYLNNYSEIYGITSDGTHLYMVARKTGGGTFIVKALASDGSFVAELEEATMPGTSAANPGFAGARGLVYAPSSGMLYVAGFEDCVSIVRASDLTYIGAGAGVVNQAISEPKAIGILKEACPTSTPQTLDLTICSNGNGEKIFLQELLECDGIITEGIWTETSNTSNGGIAFEQCDLSILVNGSGCATYTLSSDGSTGLCGPFDITVNICTQVPDATLAGLTGTCANTTTPNDDASISLTGIENVDEINFSTGATYSGPAYNGAGAIAISGTTGSITGLMHNTQYTVRLFNGANDCFVDKTFTTPTIDCSAPPCVTPDAGADFTICLPKTTLDLADAPTGTEWITSSTATIDASTGEITGLATAGVFTFTLQTIGDPTCKDDMTVTVTDGDAPNILCNDGSTSVTLIAPANLINVKWYSMDGTEVGSGNDLIATSNTGGLADGTEAYYYIGEDGTASGCAVELCCPVKFITQDCCPTPNCASVTVIKN